MKLCPICKTQFKPKQWKQKYCCPACYNVARHAQDRARAKRNYRDPITRKQYMWLWRYVQVITLTVIMETALLGIIIYILVVVR